MEPVAEKTEPLLNVRNVAIVGGTGTMTPTVVWLWNDLLDWALYASPGVPLPDMPETTAALLGMTILALVGGGVTLLKRRLRDGAF